MSRESKSYKLIVNLEFNPLLSRYIPEPYIVRMEYGHTLGSLKAKATDITIPSYNILMPEDVALKVFHYSEQLSLANIEQKFITKKRNQNSLAKVMLLPEVKDILIKFYDRISNEFFQYLRKEKIPLILDIVRKTPLETLKIISAPKAIDPILRFEKIQTGVKYSLKLNNHHSPPWSPNTRDVHILTNINAWIIVDYVLYQVNEINGNKLKPFLKQDHIFIKNEMVITYFQKFILEVARKSEIEAIGFEVTQSDHIDKVRLKASYDFLAKEVVMDMIFDYDDISFLYSNEQRKRTRLHISDENQVSISQIKRNVRKENKWSQKILEGHLSLNSSKRIQYDDPDQMGLVQYLIKNKERLQSEGFQIDAPLIEGKEISLDPQSISLNTKPEEDWFDIQGVVTVGNERLPFAQLLEYIKDNNRYFPLPDGTYFLIPDSWMAKYEELAKFGVKSGNSIRIRKSQYSFIEEMDQLSSTVQKALTIDDEDVEYTPSKHLNAELRPYQEEGVKWLLKHKMNKMGACLADDMGLGKTLQTIAILSHTKDELKREKKSGDEQMTLFASEMLEDINPLRALIILPSSLVFNWNQEIKKFNKSLHVLQFIGSKRKKLYDSLDKFDVVLTTYHTVLRDISILKSIHWEYVILDESQMIKNKESKMFKAINEIPGENKLSLSGTPIENSLSDLWSQMQFINPDMLGSFSFFKENYIIPIERYKDKDSLSQLAKLIKPFILRRTKEEVAKDLPALTEKVEFITLGKKQQDVYDKIKSATRNYLLGLDDSDRSYKFHVFAALTKMRQISNDPSMVDPEYNGETDKIDHIFSQMEKIVKSGHKVLIFSSFTKLIKIYKDRCENNSWSYASLTGSDSQAKRKAAVDSFQNEKDIPFFFISLKAGGTGLNLTAADYVFILDPWWNPFAEKQAIARAHRIGQDKPVSVVRFISKETIEEKILRLQERKKTLSDDIIHFDEEKINLEQNDLNFILD